MQYERKIMIINEEMFFIKTKYLESTSKNSHLCTSLKSIYVIFISQKTNSIKKVICGFTSPAFNFLVDVK